jgi:ABC-type phosphate transport system substrate-binding protein
MVQGGPLKSAWTIIGLLTLVTASSSAATGIKVIAHASVKVSQVTSDEIKGVFLGTRTSLADGSHVEPVLLKSGDVHDTFVKLYTGKTVVGLESYYRSLVFTGKGSMPKVLTSDAEMVAYVKNTRGAIGYVSAGTNTDGVKILDVK